MFGALMVVDMMIFAFMAYRYTFADHKHNDEDKNGEEKEAVKHGGDNNVEMLERNVVEERKTKL
jgi:hypothetical protein